MVVLVMRIRESLTRVLQEFGDLMDGTDGCFKGEE